MTSDCRFTLIFGARIWAVSLITNRFPSLFATISSSLESWNIRLNYCLYGDRVNSTRHFVEASVRHKIHSIWAPENPWKKHLFVTQASIRRKSVTWQKCVTLLKIVIWQKNVTSPVKKNFANRNFSNFPILQYFIVNWRFLPMWFLFGEVTLFGEVIHWPSKALKRRDSCDEVTQW